MAYTRALRYFFNPLAGLDMDLEKCTCPDLKCVNFKFNINKLYSIIPNHNWIDFS